jgi:hypothetical protein
MMPHINTVMHKFMNLGIWSGGWGMGGDTTKRVKADFYNI